MFESDDYDEALSQFDFCDENVNSNGVEAYNQNHESTCTTEDVNESTNNRNIDKENSIIVDPNKIQENIEFSSPNNIITRPKHAKRKSIISYFDYQSKRKFPGPAGLLTDNMKDNQDSNICQIELLSQDLNFPQNDVDGDIFVCPLWKKVNQDAKGGNLGSIDFIKTIKQQALAGNLKRRKAQLVVAYVEAVDRSAVDPLITLRDPSGNIKCTLHRDAWSTFSAYIVAEYCALILWKPTVLTMGSVYKKNYLNITLSNIVAIYSRTILNEEVQQLIDGYIKEITDDYTVIRLDKSPLDDIGPNKTTSLSTNCNEFLDDFDSSIFLEETF